MGVKKCGSIYFYLFFCHPFFGATCSTIELRHEAMKKWNHIYEWSKRVKTLLDEPETASLESEDPVVRRVVERLGEPGYLREKVREQSRFDAEAAFGRLRRRNRRRLAVRVGMIAASVAIVLGGFWLFTGEPEVTPRLPLAKQVIIPGARRAMLVLDDGQSVELKDSLPVRVETKGGVIQIDSVGAVSGYMEEGDAVKNVKYNKLVIPRGGEYHMILPDGTAVWLNSETELHFPVQFSGDRREVFLRGEAYFDVKGDARKPFVVKTAAGNVNVLGTAFDVSIYDTTTLVATLERGSISFDNEEQTEVVIRPGEQLTYTEKNGQVRVEKVNTRLYTAWKDQLFCFEEQRLDEIMTVLSRWYNLDVRFEAEELKRVELSGTLDKYSDVLPLLNLFELGTNVKFEIHGNTIVVKKAR